MVTVTEDAKQLLVEMLSSHNVDDPEIALRLVHTPSGGFGLKLGREREGDQVVEHEGSKLLLLGDDVLGDLGEATLDSQETDEGPRLVYCR